MDQIALIVLWGWIAVGPLLFWRLQPSTAILVAMLGGWVLLPVADFAAMPTERRVPDWVMGAALPGMTFLTKATASAIAAMLGALLFDRHRLLLFRLAWDDISATGPWRFWRMAISSACGWPAQRSSRAGCG